MNLQGNLEIFDIRNKMSTSTFKFRAMVNYNSVPVEIKTGSIVTVKVKLKRWIQLNIPIE